VDRDALNQLIKTLFPDVSPLPVIERVDPDEVEVRLPYDAKFLRPGGALSGPAMMMLADTVAYAALLANDGSKVNAVTSHVSIHFLRRAPPGDLVGVGRLRKQGSRLAVVQVTVFDHEETPVADATVSYAMP